MPGLQELDAIDVGDVALRENAILLESVTKIGAVERRTEASELVSVAASAGVGGEGAYAGDVVGHVRQADDHTVLDDAVTEDVPESTDTSCEVAVNPAALTVTVYRPGARPPTEMRPAASAVAVPLEAASRVTTTLAPATAPLLASTACPEMVPDVCASAGEMDGANSRAANETDSKSRVGVTTSPYCRASAAPNTDAIDGGLRRTDGRIRPLRTRSGRAT
jgi:hypothetical protein